MSRQTPSELRRKCSKCYITAAEDSGLSFHRFPLPGKDSTLLKARVWAEYCFPGGEWSSIQSLRDLHTQHKMLCSNHFDDSSFTSTARVRLNNYAIPIGAEDLLVKFREEHFATPIATQDVTNIQNIEEEPSRCTTSEQCLVPDLTKPKRQTDQANGPIQQARESDLYSVHTRDTRQFHIQLYIFIIEKVYRKKYMTPIKMNTIAYFVGVDVGSGSVRAALVDSKGHVLNTSVKEIQIWKPKVDYFEQSSDDIWNCCIFVIKEVIKNTSPENIKGIGFDATCSLVALDSNENPISVSTNDNKQNVIMWMDHRAQTEADYINKTDHDILKYVGGKVSLEMEMPKLLWLKKNLPNKWKEFGYFFDLPDFLTWKATGSLSRSLCSLVCKWNYECSSDGKRGWNMSFLTEIGLEDLAAENFKKIGSKVLMPGELCGGLKKDVANILGLKPGLPVATSIIDAHAGGLGMIGTHGEGIDKEMSSRLGLICGTSTCHMAVNKTPILVDGVWGPYFSAMVPNMWLNEAGQSASGMLLDYIISSHPAGAELLKTMSSGEIRNHLRGLLVNMAQTDGHGDVNYLTKNIHVWPDFHGNRSPLANPSMRGMICGLSIDSSENNLALLYLATLQALSYGTRHIIDAMVQSGYKPFKSLLICGGIAKDPLFVQIQADSMNLPILKPHEKDSVLVGSAILAASASQYFNSVQDAIEKMGGTADICQPTNSIKSFHDKKYRVFLRMFQDQLKYRTIMSSNH